MMGEKTVNSCPKLKDKPKMFEQTFKNIDDTLWKDAGCSSELDYVEQTSWILFLKYLEVSNMDRNKKAKLKLKQQIDDNKKSKEQKAFERKIQKQRYGIDIQCIDREIKFKKEQLDNNVIIETRMINQIPGQPGIIIDGYKDHIKPAFLIENEIDKLEQRKKEFNELIESIKKAEEEDARETTEP